MKQLFLFAGADLIGVLLGLVGAYFIRFSMRPIEITKGYSPAAYIDLLPVAVAIWIFWMETIGAYAFRERAFNLQILRKIWHANVLSVMTIVCLHFFLRSTVYSRAVYPIALFTCTAGMALSRLALDRTLAHLRRSGKLPRARVLILGTGPLAATITKRIRKHAYLGLEVVGIVSTDAKELGRRISGVNVLSDFANIFQLIEKENIGEVIICQPDLSSASILEFMLRCEKAFVTARTVPDLLEAALVEMGVEQIDGIPLFGLKESPLQGWNVVIKRAIDLVITSAVLTLVSPLMLGLAIAVRLSSAGPILYRQERVGLDGKRFEMLKFRSMVQNAEAVSGPVFAVPNDSRATRLGSFLRRTNLDELPQLWNVLVGDMSLVGPRPERPHFVSQFTEDVPRYMGRHRVKSGITGWAQVHGLRGNTPVDERVKYDLYYVENWSIWLDIKILLMTVGALDNAY